MSVLLRCGTDLCLAHGTTEIISERGIDEPNIKEVLVWARYEFHLYFGIT